MRVKKFLAILLMGVLCFGSTFAQKKKQKKAKATAAASIDTDGDGLVDSQDRCPAEYGAITTDGCPDRDADGVADDADWCKEISGEINNGGCPWGLLPDKWRVDTDNDDIYDIYDEHPYESGKDCGSLPCTSPYPTILSTISLRQWRENPWEDPDRDGVSNRYDRCPNSKGTDAFYGCPLLKPHEQTVLDSISRKISFALGTYKADSLQQNTYNALVKLLKDNRMLLLEIVVHADDFATDDACLELSEQRGNTIRDYLIQKNVEPERITVTPFGNMRPIWREYNIPNEGYFSNKRVVLEARYP